jgi:hypothetical protein
MPLDLCLRHYFREHKAVGSKDRKVICEAIYGMIRYRDLLDHVSEIASPSWKTRYDAFMSHDLSRLIQVRKQSKILEYHRQISIGRRKLSNVAPAYENFAGVRCLKPKK